MIFVGMACVAVLGWLTTKVLGLVEERSIPWLRLREA